MSRKKKTYVSVMALCAVALLIDRLLLPAPSSAAGSDGDGGVSGNRVLGISPAAARIPAPEIPFPRSIATAADAGTLRDVFAAPSTLAGESTIPMAAASGTTQTSAAGREQFVQNHRLTGILSDEAIAVAIIGDRLLSAGSELDGCVLKTVEARSAVFQCVDGEARIVLPSIGDSDRKNP